MSTHQNFFPVEEAKNIDKAIQGFKEDEKQLFNLIGKRSTSQLKEIKGEYEKLFNCDLKKKLEKDVDQKTVVNLVSALFKDHAEYKGDKIYNSLKHNHKGEESLVNFVIGDTSENVENTKQYLQSKYDVSLMDLVREYTFGPFRELMVKYIENKREEGIEDEKIHSELHNLRLEKEGKWCKEEILSIFVKRSPQHIQKLSDRMKESYNITLQEMIVNETKGYFQDALLACSFPREVFWANRINTALKRCSKDDCLLVCCFSQCRKSFLQLVAKEYLDLFGVNLIEDVKKYTSGNLSVLILTLLDFQQSESDLFKSK